MRQSYKTEGSRYFLAEETQILFEDAIDFCYSLYHQTQQETYLNKAFFYLEKSQTPLLMESHKALEGQGIGGVPSSLIKAKRKNAIDLAYYKNKLSQARNHGDSSKIQLYADYFFQKKQALENLQTTLQEDYPRYYDFQYNTNTLSFTELQQQLPPETLFLQYFQTSKNIYALSISTQAAHFVALSTPANVKTQITQLYKGIQVPLNSSPSNTTAFQAFVQPAHALYQSLLQPILDVQKEPINRLVIVSNGALTQILFEVLLQKEPMQEVPNYLDLAYLNQNFAISYQPSASLYLRFNQQIQHPEKADLLAFAPFAEGSPIAASAENRMELKALPYSKAEVEQVNQSFLTHSYFSKAANKNSFLQQAAQYRILHLATHAMADYENPTNAYLVFQNHIDQSKYDFLYNYEIQHLQFSADLIVLSACETGAGKVDQGEGVLSLARGFLYTGIPSVLMTKWPINDKSSSQIIGRFYQELKQGKTKDIALQQAKLHYLQTEADAISAHPFYWAGFAQIGSAKSLSTSTFNPWYWVGLLLLILCFLGLLKRNTQLD